MNYEQGSQWPMLPYSSLPGRLKDVWLLTLPSIPHISSKPALVAEYLIRTAPRDPGEGEEERG